MEKIEEKLNIERDILDLKRQYKLVFHQTEDAKTEYNAIIDSINRNKEVLTEQKDYLSQVLNDISNAKLSWALEKDEEWQKINSKLAEAENVLKRKKELNEQEQTLRDIEQKDTNIRNETRQLELKIQADKLLLENKEKELSNKEENIKKSETKLVEKKEKFKEELIKLTEKYK